MSRVRQNIIREDSVVKEFIKSFPGEEPIFELIATNNQKTADFYLPHKKILGEIKEIHDVEQNKSLAQWGKIISKLRESVQKNVDYKKVTGLFSINTPPVFKFPTEKFHHEKAAEELIRAVLEGRGNLVLHGIEFKIEKISEKESGIYFGAVGGGGFVNPAGTIYQNIFNKINIANEQLSSDYGKEVSKKILLLVSRYHFANRIDDVIRGISYGYEKLITLANIDEIWLQIPLENTTKNILIYAKDFFSQYENDNISISTRNAELYQLWYYALVEKDDLHKEKLFTWLKSFLEEYPPYLIFDDKFKRQEMVRLGEWLAQKERYDEAIWLIGKFIDDPDPPEPNLYSGAPEFNYHERILKGEDPSIITTVLGHLAWVIQKLCLTEKYINKGLEFTTRLLMHKNLYVKLQATVPLIEIASRRQWLEGYGKRPYQGQYKVFHDLVFNLLDLVKRNENIKAIADRLVHVFYSYKDLSTEESIYVLDILKNSEDAAGLFIYFGLYRGNHYKDYPIEFDDEKLNIKLKSVIEDKEEWAKHLQAGFAWIFRDILKDNPQDFTKIKPYLDLLLKLPYDRNLYHNIQYFLQEWIQRETKLCIDWFSIMLENVIKFAMLENEKNKRLDLWIDSSEEVLQAVAEKDPEQLSKLMSKLVKLWKLGAFIGDIKILFETCYLIDDLEKKKKVEKIFKRWYFSMKKINPRLKDINWQ